MPRLTCIDYIAIIGDRNYPFDGLSSQGVVAKKLKNTWDNGDIGRIIQFAVSVSLKTAIIGKTDALVATFLDDLFAFLYVGW